MAKPQNVDWSNSERPEEAQDETQINPGTKPNASAPKPPHDNPDAVEHAMIGEAGGGKREGGRDESQVSAPTVSMYPSSQPQGDGAEDDEGEYDIIDDVNLSIYGSVPEAVQVKFKYPFNELDIGQGMFIPVEKHSTTDKLMSQLFKQVDQFRKQNSVQECDEDGDTVMEDVAINKKLRNEDGTVILDGTEPRLGIKSGFRPKLIGPNFAVKAVVKGDKLSENDEASGDGALIIRLG